MANKFRMAGELSAINRPLNSNPASSKKLLLQERSFGGATVNKTLSPVLCATRAGAGRVSVSRADALCSAPTPGVTCPAALPPSTGAVCPSVRPSLLCALVAECASVETGARISPSRPGSWPFRRPLDGVLSPWSTQSPPPSVALPLLGRHTPLAMFSSCFSQVSCHCN